MVVVASGPRMMGDEAAREPSQDLFAPVRPQMALDVTDVAFGDLVSLNSSFQGLRLIISMSLSDVAMDGRALEGREVGLRILIDWAIKE